MNKISLRLFFFFSFPSLKDYHYLVSSKQEYTKTWISIGCKFIHNNLTRTYTAWKKPFKPFIPLKIKKKKNQWTTRCWKFSIRIKRIWAQYQNSTQNQLNVKQTPRKKKTDSRSRPTRWKVSSSRAKPQPAWVHRYKVWRLRIKSFILQLTRKQFVAEWKIGVSYWT